MSQMDIEGIWRENSEMMTEQQTGRKKPKLYEYEKEAMNKLKETYHVVH